MGILRVTQIGLKTEKVSDFESSHWRHMWVVRGGVQVLQLEECNLPESTTTCQHKEYSLPVSVELILEDGEC